MLKATTAETVVVVNSRELVPICAANGIKAVHIDELASLGNICGSKIICVDDDGAYDMGQQIVDQGMDHRHVTAVDLQTFANGSKDLLTGGDIGFIRECARPLHFNMVRSLYDATDGPANQERIPSGLPFLDEHLMWRRREVCVVTGPYGCGKSLLMHVLAMKWAEGTGGKYPDGSDREAPAWLCTWEDDPVEQRDQIYRHYTCGSKEPSKWQLAQAAQIQKKVWHTHPEFTRTRNLDWYLDTARMMNEDYGTNFFVLDPWSEFDHTRHSHENETEYCKRIMKELNKLSIELNAIFCVVTHLPKAKYTEDGGVKPFRVADAMGSVQFGSSAARGICVLRAKVMSQHNDERDYLVTHFDKVKIERNMGRKGTLALRYHEDRHALEHCAEASRMAKEMWSGARKEGQQ
jgi:hypothetical protein